MTVRNRKGSSKRVIVLLVIGIVIVLSITGAVFAKYMAERLETDDAVSGNFYFSSDTLKKTTNEKDANNWVDGITFKLYNYEVSNPALVSDNDIEYSVILPSGWEVDSVIDDNGNTVAKVGEVYKISGSPEKKYHTVTIKPTDPEIVNVSNPLSVKVRTKTPYVTELSTDFTLIGSPLPDYKIENNSTYVLVTVYTNLYEGNVTVNWTNKFLPNNADPIMSGWVDVNTATLIASKNHTYELIFFKTTAENYSKALEKGTKTIQIGD
ncbi:MAG: hypothetical protein IJ445_03775 [Clostridia bacterium]|nr:hypothetical protein [Clostridia bacterium]